MIDRRESILQRLVAISEAIPGIKKVGRNQEDVSGRDRPAVIIHDAAESADDIANRPRGVMKEFMTMSPQMFILAGAPSPDIGTLVSQYRALFVTGVFGDTQLRALCKPPQGDIRFTGCGLDTTTGTTREARLEMSFEFTYLFDPAELIG